MAIAARDSRSWTVAPADVSAVRRLVEAGHSPVVARVLASRGIADAAAAAGFLAPDLADWWLDPLVIPGMAEAAAEVGTAVREGRRVVVFGDFDLDGVSAAALVTLGLRGFGADVAAVVPHRFREGYGLSEAALERVVALGPELVVTVDCGVSSAAEVAALLDRGVRVVVTDHHEPGDRLPAGVPVANPKLGEGGADAPSSSLAGAGVGLKLVQAVGASLGDASGWRGLTDLAMLGTVADIVPLLGENRALVADGLLRVRTAPRPSIAALAAVASADLASMDSEGVAYALAPRLNAAGRVADPTVALELLLEGEPARAADLAAELDGYNRARQAAEQELLSAAAPLAAESLGSGANAIVLAGEGWHEGVKGIVASRLAATHGVPALLFCVEDGVAVGSGRTARGIDLYEAVAAQADILARFGGHTAAVGLALPAERLEEFRRGLERHLAALPEAPLAQTLTVDAEVRLEELGPELAAEIALLGPFGLGNLRPLLGASGVFMNGRQKVGRAAEHLRFVAYDGAVSVPAVAFRCRDIDAAAAHDGAADLAFQLDVDEWRGRRRVQMLVRSIVRREAPREGPVAELVEDLFAHAEEICSREEYAGIGEAEAFHTKLAGVTFEGRQGLVARLTPGMPLRLVRQPGNEHDPNAIAVFDPQGDQVGFLNRRLAAVLAPVLDAGNEYDVEVTDVTGGEGERSCGVNVLLSRRDAARAVEEEAAAAVERRAALAALDDSELDAALVRSSIGEATLHEAQSAALRALGAGRSTLAVMATGRGKSLIFHLHAARLALRGEGASVFVYPLRALVADQAFHLEERYASIGLTVRTVSGETSAGARDAAFEALGSGALDAVLTTPEFLWHHRGRFAAAGRVRFVVVDEAHHVGMSRAGHRPAYALLGETLEALGRPLVLAATATAGDDVAEAVKATLGIEETVLDPTVRGNLRLCDERGGSKNAAAKDERVAAVVAEGTKTIVYVNSREQSVRLARMLRARVPGLAWRVAFYNGGLSRPARHAVENALRSGELEAVVATSAFGEGVDIPDVRDVVLYHLPFNDVEFNQMSGRAGRDGAEARVHLLFGERDGRVNELILEAQAPERDDLAALWLVLKDLEAAGEGEIEITNAELAARVRTRRPRTSLTDRGVSAGLGVFRELGLVTGEGHGAYRRLRVVPDAGRVDLARSVRYAEARDETEQFRAFREWALSAPAPELLARFNRPILPSRA